MTSGRALFVFLSAVVLAALFALGIPAGFRWPELGPGIRRATATSVRELNPAAGALALPVNQGSIRFAVIGGSGLYEIPGIEDVKEIRVKTPFGDPSDAIVVGKLAGVRCAFLPRHGRGHRFLPSEIPARANIYALKSLGVEQIIGVGACGRKTATQPFCSCSIQ